MGWFRFRFQKAYKKMIDGIIYYLEVLEVPSDFRNQFNWHRQ